MTTPESLSRFQEASLEQPMRAQRLKAALIIALRTAHEAALRCDRESDAAILEYRFQVRSNALRADVSGATFDRVVRGAPPATDVTDCISRALNQPFQLSTTPDEPFLENVEVEVPLEISIGAAAGNSTAFK